MKISFLTRVDCFDKYGGDTYQIEQYKKHLESYGETVTINCNLNFPKDSDFYILVNLDRPIELNIYYAMLKKFHLEEKAILLPIHHSLDAINKFELHSRSGWLGFVSKIITKYNTREKIKNIYRAINYPILRKAAFLHLFVDYDSKLKEILKQVNYCIVLSFTEIENIKKDYGVDISEKAVLVRNGVDLIPELSDNIDNRDIDVLVCGRIEERKNSLAILRELGQTNLTVVFVGGENLNNKKYVTRFKNEISKYSNITFIGKKKPEDLISLYRHSRFHVSASWFEVASLVDLEAYAYGCQVISSTEGSTHEYLKDNARYISPHNIKSLTDLLTEPYSDKNPSEQYQYINQNYTWKIASKKLHGFLLEVVNVK
ncbi:glycosyltransferase family 4 protein [Klebsiella quasipneumoniae]|uniref:glycosyltransferase family 4 protein n=1 Tax=Klebsiella quasipneumoniae TaxID=1463165 RepID=UPI000B41D3B8|nr:glycosyltransferase family 4 protein [Klebsiella quasipneumoniae]MDJ1034080.1 glycosyltransferase family 4 protein [Klebsiella quasipneumoniae]RNT45102.1 glycosyltransferase [Klebsiella quasipneumoniae subsp. quasipneumoniae]HBQ3014171.1 glycosyltransferase family 4 protein [Klebsiella quasipneumoniae subsp. quasipneumoniae]HBW1846912.1 glycosyltransferase family 4 protein [Klebsiella quasipneumoniae subsp. quasipneumoniae]HCM7678450.1 glycosyltransferase family 4 protein [Klebsiella quasip